MRDAERLEAVLTLIDAANAHDPNTEMSDDGPQPAALLYGRRMSQVLREFVAAPSEHLEVAVRGQHIERWLRPRKDFPTGREGYLEWRRAAGRYHAERTQALMAEAGYDEADRARVGVILRKEGIKRDDEVQSLEDVACLVFMRWYFAPFAETRMPEDLVKIVAKTARKMSGAGRQAALKLPLPADLVPVIEGAT